MKTELRDLLEELGTRGVLLMAASVCRQEAAFHADLGGANHEMDAAIWRVRAGDFDKLLEAQPLPGEPRHTVVPVDVNAMCAELDGFIAELQRERAEG